MKSNIFILSLLIIFCQATNAQVTKPLLKNESILLDEHIDLQEQLIPLDSILTLAVKNSSAVKFQADLIKVAQDQLTTNKNLWTNNLVGFINYSEGNQSIVTADNTTPGVVNSSNISNGLRFGVQLNLPLSELMTRKSRMASFKNTITSTIDKRDQAIEELKQVVIQLYYTLIYNSNLLSIRSEAKASAINQYSIAEKQFKEGAIDIGELSRLKTIEVNARADYEEVRREFATAYYQMEPLVGVPFQQLILKK
jgi:outer membrane protein TolC